MNLSRGISLVAFLVALLPVAAQAGAVVGDQSVNRSEGGGAAVPVSAASVASMPDGTPPKLPATGMAGQVISFASVLPHGGKRVWTYAWTDSPKGGSWVLTSQGSCSKPGCDVVITQPH